VATNGGLQLVKPKGLVIKKKRGNQKWGGPSTPKVFKVSSWGKKQEGAKLKIRLTGKKGEGHRRPIKQRSRETKKKN